MDEFDMESAWAAQEMNEQLRWEDENGVQSILDSDPEYAGWSSQFDMTDDILDEMAQVELERSFNVMTAWD